MPSVLARGVPVQEILAHKKQLPSQDHTLGICLGLYRGPRGGCFL